MNGLDRCMCTRGSMVCIYAKAQANRFPKTLLPSRVHRGNAILAALSPQLSSRGGGGPPGAVWLCTGADCPVHARSSSADLPLGPRVSLARTVKPRLLAHLHFASASGGPGDGQLSAYSLHQPARDAPPRVTPVSRAPVLHRALQHS